MLPLALELRDKHNAGALCLKLHTANVVVDANGAKYNKAYVDDGFQRVDYLAPEQLNGGHVSFKSDIYAFCALLNFAFNSINTESTNESTSNDSTEFCTEQSKSESCETLCEPLNDILNKGMAQNPDDRFSSMQELILELAPYNTGTVKFGSFEALGASAKQAGTKRKPVLKLIIGTVVWLALCAALLFCCQTRVLDMMLANAESHDYEGTITLSKQVIVDTEESQNYVKYSVAGRALTAKEYDIAISLLEDLGDFLDSKELVKECQYRKAAIIADSGDYDTAIEMYDALGDYSDATQKSMDALYRKGKAYLDNGEYTKALNTYDELKKKGWGDVTELKNEVYYKWSDFLCTEKEDYLGAYEKIKKCLSYSNAKEIKDLLETTIYSYGVANYQGTDYSEAEKYFKALPIGYERRSDYLFLIEIHNGLYTITAADVDSDLRGAHAYHGNYTYEKAYEGLLNLVGFEDAADLILEAEILGMYFFKNSKWVLANGSQKWTFGENLTMTDDLPSVITSSCYWWLDSGFIWQFKKGQTFANAVKDKKITIVNYYLINVFCFKDGKTYTLYRLG